MTAFAMMRVISALGVFGIKLLAMSPDAIAKKTDEIRNPSESYLMLVEVECCEMAENSLFEVRLQGNQHTLVRTLKPARDRGRNMLMKGEQMWAYIPNLKRAVRVGLGQKLTGQASNGDISRMRWSGDYEPKIEKETDKEWTLFLTAKKKGLTYDKIRAWIEKKTFFPLRAEYLTPHGKTLKKARYQKFQQMAGRIRPTEIVIEDALRKGDVSTLKIKRMEVRDFPDSLFHQNTLSRTE